MPEPTPPQVPVFVQLAAGHSLYALDREGQVWQLTSDTKWSTVKDEDGQDVQRATDYRSGWVKVTTDVLIPFEREAKAHG
jgi:alpha-tubulin suppressor-like RCC1 family protein